MSRVEVRLPRSDRRVDLIQIVVVGLFLIAAVVVVVPALRTPGHVDEVTIDNPHQWSVKVDVTGGDRDGWVGIGTVRAGSEQTFSSVIDHGDVWVFRFSHISESVEAEMTRRELEQDDWQVTVPDELADRPRSDD